MRIANRMTPNADEIFMARALDLAHRAADCGEVPVGAVLVASDGETIIAEGFNTPIADHDPTAHAEINCIRSAANIANNYRLFETSLYVTLEPCTMCAGAIANARIRRIVFAAPDEKGGAVINGVRFFEQPTCHWHPEIVQGPFAAESAELLRAFFRSRRGK